MPDAVDQKAKPFRFIAWMERHSHKKWFWGSVWLCPALDYVLPMLPNQMLMIALSALKPARWLFIALLFVSASAAGAYAAAFAVQQFQEAAASLLPAADEASAAWTSAKANVERWGLWALAVLSLSPFPPRLGVLVCAAAGMPPEQIGLVVAAGRTSPAIILTFLAAKAPARLRGYRKLDALFDRLGLSAQR
jgi:hypothetical protein